MQPTTPIECHFDVSQNVRMSSKLWQRIRAARRFSGLKQSDIATKIGVSRSAVSQWEIDGDKTPTLDNLRHFSEATGCPMEWLVSNDSDISHHWAVEITKPESADIVPIREGVTIGGNLAGITPANEEIEYQHWQDYAEILSYAATKAFGADSYSVNGRIHTKLGMVRTDLELHYPCPAIVMINVPDIRIAAARERSGRELERSAIEARFIDTLTLAAFRAKHSARHYVVVAITSPLSLERYTDELEALRETGIIDHLTVLENGIPIEDQVLETLRLLKSR
jgi:transcriptional regulator with XRE-family HTH domain